MDISYYWDRHCFKKVIFAIPQDIHGGNYDKFAKVLGGIKNDT